MAAMKASSLSEASSIAAGRGGGKSVFSSSEERRSGSPPKRDLEISNSFSDSAGEAARTMVAGCWVQTSCRVGEDVLVLRVETFPDKLRTHPCYLQS